MSDFFRSLLGSLIFRVFSSLSIEALSILSIGGSVTPTLLPVATNL
jgi:hypothetical protein